MNIKEIEDKIKGIVSKEALKSAKILYLASAVVFSYLDKNTIIIIIRDKNNILNDIKIYDIDSFINDHVQNGFNSVDIVALFYFYEFYNERINSYLLPEQNGFENSENLLGHNLVIKNKGANKLPSLLKPESDFLVPQAKLIINSSKSFPYSSSTWESCSISIELRYRGRSYIGNSNKLRQLRFDDGKASLVKMSDFSSQDRQIIRFLSQYAEPDGSGFSLRSEIMAEFLHSLHGFEGFYFGNEQIIIHKNCADIVGLYSKKMENQRLIPALFIDGNFIPLNRQFSLVLGKSGVWIGVFGEYWWVPAIYDIIWLRKFLLSENINISSMERLKNYPIKIIFTDRKELIEKNCKCEYYINFTDENKLNILLKYNYSNILLPVSNKKVAKQNDCFWKRDKKYEKEREIELLKYGFSVELNNEYYTMQDVEGIGFFLDTVYPLWVNDLKHVYILPNAIAICNPVRTLEFICSSPLETKDCCKFKYEIKVGNGNATWKLLLKNVNENRRYILLDNNTVAVISKDLSGFVSLFSNIVKSPKSSGVLQIPKGAILYWAKAGKSIFRNMPSEWDVFDNIESTVLTKSKSIINVDSFKGNLRSYQLKAVQWMKKMILNGFNVILADEMGLGKTIQALAFITQYKQRISKSLPCMVVCPTSLVDNWKAECEKFTPTLRILMISGSNREDSLQRIKEYDLIITSYALIKKDIDSYSKLKFGLLVLDEAQHIKNPATINAKVCKSIISKHRIVLTGTPLENSPEDIWSIFDFLNPGMLGSRESFKALYSRIDYEREKQKELADRIAPFILRRHKKDVEQLPEKTEQTLYCEMSKAQSNLYKTLQKDGKARYQSFYDGKTTKFDILTSLLRLRQLCCHPKLLPDNLRRGIIESTKTELLKELLLEAIDSGHRTLVFSQFTSLLAILKDWLNEKNIRYEYLDGSTKNRFEKVKKFNANKDISVFLLSLKAGGTGLNLTGADTVIIYDPWWNPSAEAQATDRTHRIGQKNKITSIKLVVRDSIEEKILELQSKKQGLFDGIVENSSSFKKLSDKDIAYLLK